MSLIDLVRAVRFLRQRKPDSEAAASIEWAGGQLIYDRHRKLGSFEKQKIAVNTEINKEIDARQIIFDAETPSGLFFEIGSGSGDLTYLLGIQGNFKFDEREQEKNRARFEQKFHYRGNDLEGDEERNIFGGDICSPLFLQNSGCKPESAAVVYSNNVFEHLRRPWIAAENAYRILKPGGVCITVVPFSQRYHESPGDYFRYTHAGLASLFENVGPVEELLSGYDILGRRNNWQGGGNANDLVPMDAFGAWRETWFTFYAFRKPLGQTQVQ
ncbi:class I SAM-dependent methyltransferase [Rhizobium leguminosarum]|uniref:class I SAM-dependent methyltransferase n=1 Tax=Rhizobium leguminosarum TaxID=384 RepID=UPI001A915173|nr:methyltransferase domain-containing protein [Rhizobium leguminosarum]MBY5554649.1 class I SAM-dependent methyltransferase [Rhizobium leguminosarum]MBY5559229.1 class I SAM-dependent methyltransferase [Rhizobium leguminosarum]MBY5636348.1 class I SAM-dependent methyltransferase [Rhizobium leguminosarum]MBY5690006.1 class I SAM-dependent methyltransferase [Rhizobium leguminosarum]MBY5708362.1 class I SAM-dependent methyltransferase [Rhizobium leguminosarum]